MLKLVAVIVLATHLGDCFVSFQPEQVHLSYGDNPYELVVTWNTMNNTGSSVVEYGINGLVLKAFGKPKEFVSGGKEKRHQYVHSVKIGNLIKDSKYLYHCGSSLGWSSLFWFKTSPEQESWSPRLAVYGDMGNINPQSLPRLQTETQREMYDAILHVGDFAYDLNSENGRVGDEFMRQIETIAAYVPYMTCPGNHEEKYNFSDYKSRFNMPGNTGSIMYSFNMGPIHFISISTEVYYFLRYGAKLVSKQYTWLENDLKEATSISNRTKRPWIIVFGHRPMYCSNTGHADCNNHETRTRTGLPIIQMFGLEKLFYHYGVDLEIWAHEHSYERLWPIYNYIVRNGSLNEPYHNPLAPIHITTGSAGCKENITDFPDTMPSWSAFRSTDYGYMRLQAFNLTHLYLEQVSDDKDGEVIDHVWIIKDRHRAYDDIDDSIDIHQD